MAEQSGDLFIHALSNAITARSIYPASHPLALEPLQVLEASLVERFAEEGITSVTLLLVDGDLVVDGEALRSKNLYRDGLRRTFERNKVEKLTVIKGVTRPELEAVTSGLCKRSRLESTDQVIWGRIALEGDQDSDAASGTLDESHIEVLEKGLELMESDDEAGFKKLDHGLWLLIEASVDTPRKFLLLSELASDAAPLYRHLVSVCLHTLFFGRALGMSGPALHSLSLGALLHDIGLLSLPTRLVRGEGATTELAQVALQRHPALGASRLAMIPGVPEETILIAYEHHMHWDGAGGYPLSGRQPGLGAQITAIADVWDMALNTPGPSARDARRRLAAKSLAQRVGDFLNPRLADSFISLMRH